MYRYTGYPNTSHEAFKIRPFVKGAGCLYHALGQCRNYKSIQADAKLHYTQLYAFSITFERTFLITRRWPVSQYCAVQSHREENSVARSPLLKICPLVLVRTGIRSYCFNKIIVFNLLRLTFN